MFDYVSYKMKCPKCGATVDNFQTKDLGCELSVVNYKKINYFYCTCPDCEAWIEFTRKPAKSIKDFKIRVRR